LPLSNLLSGIIRKGLRKYLLVWRRVKRKKAVSGCGPSTLLCAPHKTTLIMNDLQTIYYCDVAEKCWDCSGKVYDIKVGRKGTKSEWKHINVNGGKIGVDNLPKKLKIFNFDDFVFAYSFNLCERYPCIAMGYYVFLIQSKRRMTMAEFKVSGYC